MKSPNRFFHYEPLFASSFSENSIILEAECFQRANGLVILIVSCF
jgi:hypothetical protein